MSAYDWRSEMREEALNAAVRWRSATAAAGSAYDHNAAHDVVTVAEVFYRWILTGNRKDFLIMAASAPVRIPGQPPAPGGAASPTRGQDLMANPQVPVGYQFDLTVSPVDVLGNPVADMLTWHDSDTSGATSITVDDATTLKVTVKVTGTATGVVITATDAGGLTGTYTFDAVPDVATALTLAPGAPVKIPAA